jgi:transcriptional regulator with XRE-family HTH domain
MDGVYEGWGAKVAKKRGAFGMSQEDLAHATTLTQATISRIESGVQAPSDRAKWLIAGALRSTLDELFPWPAVCPPIPEQAA